MNGWILASKEEIREQTSEEVEYFHYIAYITLLTPILITLMI